MKKPAKVIIFSLLVFFGMAAAFLLGDFEFSGHRVIVHKAHSAKHTKPHLKLYPASSVSVTPSATASPTISLTASGSAIGLIGPLKNDFCLKVPVIYYHHIQSLAQAKTMNQVSLTVDTAIFDQQMGYLASHGYKSLIADDLVNALINHQQLPLKSVIVTFDDGYADMYTNAYPILQKYNIIGNLMIPTGLINNPDYLTWSQLQQMAANTGLIHVYNHTWSHASLGSAKQDKIESEITTAKNQLQQNLGVTTNVFAYPYGSFSPLAISLLKSNGYIGAYATLPGSLQCESYIMTLHRIHMGNAPMSAYGL